MKDQSVLLKWSAPFSHDITGVERDISHYVVNIINMASHSMLSDNTTHTEYLLELGQCQFNEYQVEIAAVKKTMSIKLCATLYPINTVAMVILC